MTEPAAIAMEQMGDQREECHLSTESLESYCSASQAWRTGLVVEPTLPALTVCETHALKFFAPADLRRELYD